MQTNKHCLSNCDHCPKELKPLYWAKWTMEWAAPLRAVNVVKDDRIVMTLIGTLTFGENLPQPSPNVEISYTSPTHDHSPRPVSINNVCKMGSTSSFRSVQRGESWCCTAVSVTFWELRWWIIWLYSDHGGGNMDPLLDTWIQDRVQ